MLQNQRPTKNLYRIDSKKNLDRINLDVWSQKVMIFDAFKCEVLDFVARMNLPKEMMLQNQRPVILDILDWLENFVKKLMRQNQRQALGTLEGLVKLVKLVSTLMLQNQRHLGLWMGLVKLVSTFMLQNQRQALGTLDGACKTCKHIHATKPKTNKASLQNRL